MLEGGFPRPPSVSGMRTHRDGNVEAVTSARNCHPQPVAPNRAAKVQPVSEGLGEGVELGPEWAKCRHLGGAVVWGKAEGVLWISAFGSERPGGSSIERRGLGDDGVRSWGGHFPPLGVPRILGEGLL